MLANFRRNNRLASGGDSAFHKYGGLMIYDLWETVIQMNVGVEFLNRDFVGKR